MAYLTVTITPDSRDGTKAYLTGTFSGGSDDYLYEKYLRVTILGDDTYNIKSAEDKGGYNTWSKTFTGLEPKTTYFWSATMRTRVTGGWTDSSYEVRGESFTTASAPVKTYYATLAYDANGGSGAPGSQSGNATNDNGYVTFTISKTEPTRSGSSFNGWTLSGSSNTYWGGDSIAVWGSTSSPGPTHTLTAQWTKVTTYYVSISYDANGGSGAPSKHIESTTGGDGYVTAYLKTTKPSKSGYVFTGWKLSGSSSSTLYQPGGKIILWGSTSSSGQAYTMVAQWALDTSGAIWVSNGSTYRKALLWIYVADANGVGSWQRSIPWIYNGGWYRSV